MGGRGSKKVSYKFFGKKGGSMFRSLRSTQPMDAVKDEDGELLFGAEDWSLKCLIMMARSCLDFAKEMTALQHVGHQLGVLVIITPKFHAELAGEGIARSCVVSKGVYWRSALNSKRNNESFN